MFYCRLFRVYEFFLSNPRLFINFHVAIAMCCLHDIALLALFTITTRTQICNHWRALYANSYSPLVNDRFAFFSPLSFCIYFLVLKVGMVSIWLYLPRYSSISHSYLYSTIYTEYTTISMCVHSFAKFSLFVFATFSHLHRDCVHSAPFACITNMRN